MGLIPNEFKINGDVVIRFDRDNLLMTAMVVVIVVILALGAQRIFKAI